MTDPRIAVLAAISSPDWHPVPEAHGMPWGEAEQLLAAYDASRAAAPSAPARPFVPPAADGLPLAALDSATDGANALDAWARDPRGRNFLAHALVQLARDGWLRPEQGDGFEPVRDRETPDPEGPAELRRMADEAQQAEPIVTVHTAPHLSTAAEEALGALVDVAKAQMTDEAQHTPEPS